ncbi:CHASE2 domain-containing protein [Undibacterium terreum]|uniref:histidine kinase n=1 Tax=Undibacterium terreum TaxID=1224302 RepID=A0A916XPB3_9BURK|nr:CHASE2 domain-containing protein [Undibacterium terreum]GGC89676.1 two-component system sensor kinase [Undibacterium terreum]
MKHIADAKAGTSSSAEHIALREWLIISILLLVLAAGLSLFNIMGRLDLNLYDRFMQANTQPARDDVIIVAIDDYSLNELGKWPWPRTRHAELISRLAAMQPLAIGIDIKFSEPESPQQDSAGNPVHGDTVLANAITASNRVVLPLNAEEAGAGLVATLPIPVLANAARQLGHIHVEQDRDGIVRSVFLREGIKGNWWSHFGLAMKDLGRPAAATAEIPGARLTADLRRLQYTAKPDNPNAWQRDYQMHIPFYGSAGHFKSVPYVAVLRGEVPAEFFKNKYVLVGPTAFGMADSFPTPVSGNDGVISGVEINANILSSLLDGRSIAFAPLWQTLLFCLLPVALTLLCYFLLSPRISLLVTGLVCMGLLAGSYFALTAGYWLPPSAALLTLILAYPVWSWRRLEAAMRYLAAEFLLLDKEPHLLPELAPAGKTRPAPLQDALEQRINAMQVAARRVRDLRQFVTDSLSSLPDATLVTTIDGNVLLSNQPAKDYFASIGTPQVQDALMPYLFAGMSNPKALDQTPNVEFSWWNLLDLEHTATISQGIEVSDTQGRNLIIKSAPCYSSSKELIGWIVSVIDITAIRSAERSRDESLHFISHDMRSPQASILALLELQQDQATALPQAEFISRIERAATATLSLADDFVQLVRAESQNYRLEETDMQDILLDATEEMWALSKNKNIRILSHTPGDYYPVNVDRSLMTRVLTNLLSNAIKYSPADTTITCSLQFEQGADGTVVICSISDQGYGIARADQARLFQRFQRFKHSDQGKADGIGLGMVFVKTVIDRHRGQIGFHSVLNEGTTFHIKLPAFDA